MMDIKGFINEFNKLDILPFLNKIDIVDDIGKFVSINTNNGYNTFPVKRTTISINIGNALATTGDIDKPKEIFNAINIEFYKIMVSELFDNNEISYVELSEDVRSNKLTTTRDKQLDLYRLLRYEFMNKSSVRPDFLISNPRIGCNFSDYYNIKLSEEVSNQFGGFYKYGEISTIPIYVDPYMYWNDDFVILGSDGKYGFNLIDVCETANPSNYGKTFNVLLSYFIYVDSPRKIYVFDDKDSKNYKLFDSDRLIAMRDSKIDELLNGGDN